MTPEERLKAFTEAYNALIFQFGVGFRPYLMIEGLGEVQLTSPDKKLGMVTVLVDDWQPPKAEDNP